MPSGEDLLTRLPIQQAVLDLSLKIIYILILLKPLIVCYPVSSSESVYQNRLVVCTHIYSTAVYTLSKVLASGVRS